MLLIKLHPGGDPAVRLEKCLEIADENGGSLRQLAGFWF